MSDAAAPLILPPGYDLRRASLATLRERDSLTDLCVMWEAPRTRGPRRYVIGADIGDGLGGERDFSVAQVIRVGTLEEPAEQVAEFVSNTIAPAHFATILYALGMLYKDADGIEALMAVETNNHGLSTQDTLQLHLGYGNFYIWEYYDQRDPEARRSNKVGWYTNQRTRPIMLDKCITALTTLDEITGLPDLITHSAYLHDELMDFQTVGQLWEAEAAPGAHDDAIMALAIANYVAWRLQGGETEPLEDRRRRRTKQKFELALAAEVAGRQDAGLPDWRNTPAEAEEAHMAPLGQTDAADESWTLAQQQIEDLARDARAMDAEDDPWDLVRGDGGW